MYKEIKTLGGERQEQIKEQLRRGKIKRQSENNRMKGQITENHLCIKEKRLNKGNYMQMNDKNTKNKK